jgi:hypothetical protein
MENNVAFEKEVKKHFLFLVTDYGFQLSSIQQVGFVKSIKFESKEVYVNLFYGPPAYEVEVSFGRKGIDDLPGAYSFQPGDLILLGRCPTWPWNSNESDKLRGSVAVYARFLRECGSDCLKGDQLIFAQMKRNSDAFAQKRAQEERIKRVRQAANDAWHQKKYDKVVELYESIGTVLKGSEAKKLSYARKHLKI